MIGGLRAGGLAAALMMLVTFFAAPAAAAASEAAISVPKITFEPPVATQEQAPVATTAARRARTVALLALPYGESPNDS